MNFKKKVNGSWADTPHYVHKTATDTITTLPAVIYPNATTATVGLKGNMSQTGTPTPDNPIMPEGTGDLETVGAKAGQYKIPILSANTTTPVYLGEVETTRRIRKYEFTGSETWYVGSENFYSLVPETSGNGVSNSSVICSHCSGSTINTTGKAVFIKKSEIQNITTGAELKQYCLEQYANGTPVTVWYVLATPETSTVNEPLRKIGNYADTVSGITIPTIAGANSFDVLTTLKPSEVTVNYKGWHPVANVYERDDGEWT